MSDLIIHQKFSVPLNRAIVLIDWQARGYSCDLFIDNPGQAWNDYIHQCDELVTIAEGRLQMTVGEQNFIVEPGDEVFIPRGIIHSVKNIHYAVTYWFYGYNADILQNMMM